MGKNTALKTLGRIIGNIVLHKMLSKYTNKPESTGHLENEEIEYRTAALINAKKYNWNETDKQEIEAIAINFFENKRAKKYPDVTLTIAEAKALINQEITGLDI